jgi:hypothetical protein
MAMTQNHHYLYFSMMSMLAVNHNAFEAFPWFKISTADPRVAVSVTIVLATQVTSKYCWTWGATPWLIVYSNHDI